MPGDLLNTRHRIFLSFTAITINISCMRNMSRVQCLHLLSNSKYAVDKNLFLSSCSKSRCFTKSHGVITNTVDHPYFASIAVDDQYEALAANFLHTGRGRPLSQPKGIQYDNRLLVQLKTAI